MNKIMKKLCYPDPIWEDDAFPSVTTLTLLLPPSGALRPNKDIDKDIVAFLAKEGENTVTSIAKALNVSIATISLALKALKEKNVVSDNGKTTKGKLFFLS